MMALVEVSGLTQGRGSSRWVYALFSHYHSEMIVVQPLDDSDDRHYKMMEY